MPTDGKRQGKISEVVRNPSVLWQSCVESFQQGHGGECIGQIPWDVALLKGGGALARVVKGAGVLQEGSRLVPGGGLLSHELAGGHTLIRHVGLSDADLLARLAKDPGIAGASTFTSRAVAESAVVDVVETNASKIQSWIAGSRSGLSLGGTAPDAIGRYVATGSTNITDVSAVRVVLYRDPSLGVGYRIQTAYPMPAP